MAFACAALVLAITSLSAFIRLSRAGLGCEPWPQCRVQLLAASEPGAAAAGTAVAAARIAHRVTAVAALVLIIAMLMSTLAVAPMRWPQGRLVLWLLALALFLAVLGRATADSRLPAVVLANLLAGFAMLALSWRLVRATGGRVEGGAGLPRPWVLAGLVLLVLQIGLGGLVSAAYAGLSCPQLPGCDAAAGAWQAFDPWRVPRLAAAAPTNPGGAWLHLAHRAGSLLVVAVVAPLGIVGWRRGYRAGAVLVALLAAQVLAGVLLVAQSLPLAGALVHNMLAALLLATLVSLLPARERQDASPSRRP